MKIKLLSNPGITKNKPTSYFWNLLLILVLTGFGAKAQVASYQVEQLPSPGFALVSPKTALSPITAPNYDDYVGALPLPFAFNFAGVNYTAGTNMYVSLNGFMTFGTAPDVDELTPISSTVNYAGVIAPFAQDIDVLNPSNVHCVGYKVEGVAPNRILKVEWHANRSNNTLTTAAVTGDSSNLIFQAWLWETTNVIEFHYNTFNTTSIITTNPQIGLRGATNADFRNLKLTSGNWPISPNTMAVSTECNPDISENANTVIIRGGNTIVGTSNKLFRFIPVTCVAPTGVIASLISTNTATISWTAPTPAPADGYEYIVTTSTTAPTSASTPTGSTAAGVTTRNLTGLSSSTTYYVYVRSVCGPGETSCWTPAMTFTTACPAVNTPYYLGFDPLSDSFAVPNLPTCTSRQQLGSGNLWVTEGASMGDGYFDEHLVYNASGTANANVWFFTHGINLTAGTTYRLSYVYGGSTEFAFITNKMQVAYGMSPDNAGMTTVLADHNNIKASPIDGIVNFTCPATGVYYFGFKAYSASNNGKLFLDDIQVVEPGCQRVLNPTSFNITGSAASLTWDVPSPAPGGGYAYYLSNSNTPPTYTQVESGTTSPGTNVVTINGLSGNTTYYFWVRSICGPGDLGEWSLVHSFTTLNQPVYTYCTPAPISVDGTGIINVTVGSINNSTGAEPGNYGNYSSMVTNIAQGSTVTVAITFNTSIYDYNTKIWIDWNNDSDFADAGELVYSGLSSSSSPNTLMATFNVPLGAPLGEHRMRIGGADIDTLTGFGAGQGPCYTGSWASFEDYTVNVVVPPPALTLNMTSSTQCALTDSPLMQLTSPIGNYNTYSWSPSIGVSGDAVNGWTFNNSSTITYTLTATQTSLPFSTNTVSFTYFANPLPTPITLTPADADTCPGTPVQITASGGIVAGLPILEENFNGSAPGWTSGTITTGATPHSGGNVTSSHWTLRPNGYNPAGASGVGPMSSNDATQFIISNSDAQGSGTRTHVILDSPVFSLAGYTSASMSFFHYYKPWTNGYARVMISTNGGTSWTQILYWGDWNSTDNQGTPNNFAQVIYNMDAYVGQANLKVRFEYDVTWGFVWAIDNFLVSGSATSAITWSPTTGLYMDAAMTTPYVEGTGTSVVYAAPDTTTLYTASASTPAPTVCSTTAEVTINVNDVAAGTASSDQAICSGMPADLVLTGYTGTITGWQYSNSAAFTSPTNIPSSASPTLTAAQIGALAGNRWFRAEVQGDGCTVYSNIVAITVSNTTWNGTAWSNGVPSLTKGAIFAGNYNSTGSLDACSVLVQSGNVVFNSGHTLRVENEVVRTGGTLTFENNASLVQVNNSAVNSGSITYKRNTTPVTKFDYTYWASPVTPQTFVGLSPLTLSDKYFRFDTASNNFVNVAGNSLMEAGQGYIVRAPQNFSATVPAVFNGVFNGGSNDGIPNNGIITVPIVLSGANNFNLIGNPYPSAIDANLFYSANSTLIDGSFYFWTHNTPITDQEYTGSDYAIWNSTGATGTGTAGGGTGNTTVPTGNIAAGQGFFVKSIANGTAVFNNGMRLVGSNNVFYRMAGVPAQPIIEKHRVWLEMKNNQGAYKQTLVGYVDGATNQRDYAFDADAVEGGNVINLYSVLDTDKLGIQGRALPFDVNDVVPLGYRTSIPGGFEIALHQFDGLFSGQDVYLEDLATGIIHDLKSGAYSFSTDAGTFDTRFLLRYTNSTLSTGDGVISPDALVVYKDDARNIHLMATGFDMKSVQIFDVRGRLIFERNAINADTAVINDLNISQEVLIVKVMSTEGKLVTRKVIF